MCAEHTVHVTSYLWKSADFHGNSLQISVKVCEEICGSSVASPRNRLSGSVELSFGRLRIHLMGSLERSLGDRRLSSP